MTEYWVGGYTRGVDEGGGVRRLGAAGAVGAAGAAIAATTRDPSYLLPSPVHEGLLYAVDEGGDAVVVLRMSAQGDGEVLARVDVARSAPCHLAVVAGGRLLLAACYGDGAVSVHDVDDDGVPGPARALPAPPAAPNGPHPAQDGPHAHCCLELGDLVLVADLGTDRLLVYRREGGGFRLEDTVVLPPGAGPRDLLPLPSGDVLVLGEHDARVHVIDVAGRRVRASVTATTDPVRGDQAAGMTLAGSRLTVGLRGSDRIALLRLGDDGVPVPVDSAPTGGSWPRHHVVDGDRLLVANERSHTITALAFRSGTSFGSSRAVAQTPAPTFLQRIPASA